MIDDQDMQGKEDGAAEDEKVAEGDFKITSDAQKIEAGHGQETQKTMIRETFRPMKNPMRGTRTM